MQEVVVEGPEVDMLEKIKKARSKNEDVVRVVKEMKKAEVKELWGNEWQIEEDLVLKEGKVYVLKDKKLRAEVIWLHHDVPAAGHDGRWKTVELVMRNYYYYYYYYYFLINNLLHGTRGQTMLATFITTYIRRTLT